MYRPVFSKDILDEVKRTQITKFKKPYDESKADKWREQVLKAFPEALVENYKQLIPILQNHEKDRHVLAAAIRGNAQHIITANLKDFKEEHLAPWDITALHPQNYLMTLFEHSPERVTDCLHKIAEDRSKPDRHVTPEDVLRGLMKTVPLFAGNVADELGWEI